MKEFGNSLPASELEHFWLNMFNYFRKYICVHLHFTSNEEVFIQHTKNSKLKIEKKTSIEAQSLGHAPVNLHKTSESHLAQPTDENESNKDALRKQEISATPIQLHLKELYGECYSHTLTPNPELKAVSYAGKTFGRCSIISFCKVVVACSF